MDGLDLTPWIEYKSSLDTPACIFGAIFAIGAVWTLLATILGNRESRVCKKLGWGMLCTGMFIAIMSFIGLMVSVTYGYVERSGNRLGDYVADAYGVSDYDCNLDKWNGVYECRRPVDDPDMSTYDSARRTETTLKVIIRDNRAYMYDENGNLMKLEVEQ